MFDPRRLEWDRDILSFVVGGGGEAEVDKLEARLGTVANGGDKPVRLFSFALLSNLWIPIGGCSQRLTRSYSSALSRAISSSALVSARVCSLSFPFGARKGSHSLGLTLSAHYATPSSITDCLIVPFTGAEAATALAFPPDSRAGDVLISLCGVAETDSLIGPVKPGSYPTSQDWTLLLNPARAARSQGQDFASAAPSPFSQHDDGEEEGDDDDEPAFFAVVQWAPLAPMDRQYEALD